MAQFQFRLTTLLKLREAARDQWRLQLAEALRLEVVIRQRLADADQQLMELRQGHQQTAAPGLVDVDRLIAGHRYELFLRAEQHQVQAQIQDLAGEIENHRKALVAADRDVCMLEKLREQQFERHTEDENRQQARLLDEVGTRHREHEAWSGES
jgi:flagellar protein FliJ